MIVKEKIVNLETQEETIIEREMTVEEIADHEKNVAKAEAIEAKEAARAAIFERLGLTPEEAALLLA